jgi:SPP1 family predicted phage head-tail adaptor
MTDPGTFSRRLALEAPSETTDGGGGSVRSYTGVTTLWASVLPVSTRSDVEAGSLGAAITHRITIRAGRTVTTQHRFRGGTRIFRVVAVRESADRRLLEIHAEERAD